MFIYSAKRSVGSGLTRCKGSEPSETFESSLTLASSVVNKFALQCCVLVAAVLHSTKDSFAYVRPQSLVMAVLSPNSLYDQKSERFDNLLKWGNRSRTNFGR